MKRTIEVKTGDEYILRAGDETIVAQIKGDLGLVAYTPERGKYFVLYAGKPGIKEVI